jgi:dTDP-4-dehydrorhamnose reductase
LILGASGFFGPHLLVRALRLGGRPVAASRRPHVDGILAELDPSLADRREGLIESRALDLSRPAELERLLEELAPRQVVFAAALSRIAECDLDPVLARRINAEAPARVARWCAERGARLVHISTDLVFGAEAPPPRGFAEEDRPAPLSRYGSTKAEGEALVLSACPLALVVRLPLLYGSSGGRGLGASDSVLASESPQLFRDEWRTPLSARNAAQAVLELLEGSRSGLLHVAGPERASRYELGLAALRAAGRPLDRVRACTRAQAGQAGRPADVSLDASRARELLRTPLKGIELGLSEESRARG